MKPPATESKEHHIRNELVNVNLTIFIFSLMPGKIQQLTSMFSEVRQDGITTLLFCAFKAPSLARRGVVKVGDGQLASWSHMVELCWTDVCWNHVTLWTFQAVRIPKFKAFAFLKQTVSFCPSPHRLELGKALKKLPAPLMKTKVPLIGWKHVEPWPYRPYHHGGYCWGTKAESMHSTRAQKGEAGIVTASCHPWHLAGAGSGGGVLAAAYQKHDFEGAHRGTCWGGHGDVCGKCQRQRAGLAHGIATKRVTC